MIEPTRLPRLLQELDAWLPVDPDDLFGFVAAILANLETRVSQLIVAPDRQLAADVVSLLDGWRFAGTSNLDAPSLRRVSPSVRVVQVVDDRFQLTAGARRALADLSASTPVVMAEGRTRLSLRAALPWLITSIARPVDDETRAARLRHAPRARRALQSFLEMAIDNRQDLDRIELDPEDIARVVNVAAVIEAAEGRRTAGDLAPQLLALVRQRAFLSGRLRVTAHDLRVGVDIALGQLVSPLHREAIRFALQRIGDSWPMAEFEGERNDARVRALVALAKRGLLARRMDGSAAFFEGTEALRVLLI